MLSLLAMLTVSVKLPAAAGSKVTAKVVAVLLATVLAPGCAVTVKCVPVLRATAGVPVRFKSVVPVLRMVKVCTTVPPLTAVLPKSVSSATEGVVSPLGMDWPWPWTSISGAAGLFSHTLLAPSFATKASRSPSPSTSPRATP